HASAMGPARPPFRGAEPDSTGAAVADLLLAVVAEKTGYPAEALRLDMELDADLGIDSIKRVEIFSALQERLPDAPAVTTEQMPSLRTLADVVKFLGNGAAPLSREGPPGSSENGYHQT